MNEILDSIWQANHLENFIRGLNRLSAAVICRYVSLIEWSDVGFPFNIKYLLTRFTLHVH